MCISFLRGTFAAAALVVAFVGAHAEQRDETASITGHVKLTRTPAVPLSSNIYQPRAIGERSGPPPEIKNVVVYLKRPAYRGALPVSRSASILVLDHPYFVIPNLDGSFALPGVPPSIHTVVGWHERVGERSTTIDVQPGRATSLELVLPVEDSK